jgi:hypothetical protein
MVRGAVALVPGRASRLALHIFLAKASKLPVLLSTSGGPNIGEYLLLMKENRRD